MITWHASDPAPYGVDPERRWAEVPLSRGAVAIVDEADLERVTQYRWHLSFYGYAASKKYRGYMHRLIVDAQPGNTVDHINGDRLDNRRANLRIVPKATNLQKTDRLVHAHNKSGYKGVWRRSDTGRWTAQASVNGKGVSLGCYDTAEEAARAYDDFVRRQHGPHARTNFP